MMNILYQRSYIRVVKEPQLQDRFSNYYHCAFPLTSSELVRQELHVIIVHSSNMTHDSHRHMYKEA